MVGCQKKKTFEKAYHHIFLYFGFRSWARRHPLQDWLPVRGREHDGVLRGQWRPGPGRLHPSGQGKLRPLFHRHLQQTRSDRLERQLLRPANNQNPTEQVRLCFSSQNSLVKKVHCLAAFVAWNWLACQAHKTNIRYGTHILAAKLQKPAPCSFDTVHKPFFEHSGLKSYSISRNAKLDVRQFRSHEDWLFGAVDTAPKIEDDFFLQSSHVSIAVVQSVA